MPKQKKARTIKQSEIQSQWHLIQRITRFAEEIDRLPDTAEIKKEKPKASPIEMLPMIF